VQCVHDRLKVFPEFRVADVLLDQVIEVLREVHGDLPSVFQDPSAVPAAARASGVISNAERVRHLPPSSPLELVLWLTAPAVAVRPHRQRIGSCVKRIRDRPQFIAVFWIPNVLLD
jgi:hypothetical protein